MRKIKKCLQLVSTVLCTSVCTAGEFETSDDQIHTRWQCALNPKTGKDDLSRTATHHTSAEAGAATVRKTLEGCELVSGGKTVWRLNLATRESKPFIHPLCLPDGRCITEVRPADHPWHLGLWFCWKYINGLNYWEPRNPARSNLFPDGMTIVRDFVIKPKGTGCDVSVDLWYGPRREPGQVLVDEHREISFSPLDANGGYRIRSKHVFTAREKVTFDGRRPISYGGLGLRMSKAMRGCNVLVDGKSVDPKQNEAVAPGAKEVAYVRPTSGHGVSIKMLSPLPTERIYIWSNRGFANPVPFYDQPITLENGETMTLEYEVSVY